MSKFTGSTSICPFYRREKFKSITCEGYTENTEQALKFFSETDKIEYQMKYCLTFNYSECPLAILLNRKYGNPHS